MKILIVVYITFEELNEDNEVVNEVIHEIRSRRYDIYNSSDLQDTLNSMVGDIELQIETRQLQSKCRVKVIGEIVTHQDR